MPRGQACWFFLKDTYCIIVVNYVRVAIDWSAECMTRSRALNCVGRDVTAGLCHRFSRPVSFRRIRDEFPPGEIETLCRHFPKITQPMPLSTKASWLIQCPSPGVGVGGGGESVQHTAGELSDTPTSSPHAYPSLVRRLYWFPVKDHISSSWLDGPFAWRKAA